MRARVRARVLEAADARVRGAAQRLADVRYEDDLAHETARRSWRGVLDEAGARAEALRTATDVVWAWRAEVAAWGRERVESGLRSARDADAWAAACRGRAEAARAELVHALVRARALARVLRP